MMIAGRIGQDDRSFAIPRRVECGVCEVELVESPGLMKDGWRGFEYQNAGDKLGLPEDRRLVSGAIGVEQEIATPIARVRW
jgi:hypothetical protein